jgi:transposase-like protein
MKRKVNQFTDKFKHQVVQEYLETDLSQVELQKKYGIKGNTSILNWMRKFGLKEPSEDQLKIRQVMSKETEKTSHERELEEKVKELEKLLEHEKLRTLALDTMIDIAERELKISIRKKSGAKR